MAGSLSLSSWTLEDIVDRILRVTTFEFETRQPLDQCIFDLRSLQPAHGWAFFPPSTVHEVIISQFDDNSCYYDIEVRRRSGSRGSYGGRRYSATARVSGKIVYDPETDKCRVTGEARLDPMALGMAVVALVIVTLFILFFRFPTFVWFVMVAFLIYAGISAVMEQRNLIRTIHERLS